MSKKFPHLPDATEFPYQNVQPYKQYENDFDYDSWTSRVTLKACSVNWYPNSTDRVKWKDDSERDSWFDALEGTTATMDTLVSIVPDESVKLPIPYYAAQSCNYLMVDVQMQPNGAAPLDNSEGIRQRYYYFIIDTTRRAGSTTEFLLMPDNWTTYINSISFPKILLERGHAAMRYETADAYLSDPLNHTRGLLASEPDAPSEPVKVSDNSFVPFDSGELYMCFALRCSWTQFTQLKKAGAKGSFTDPTYSDTQDRWGHQYAVNGYSWDGVQNVSDVTTPNYTGYSNDNIRPNGYCMVAVKASDYVSKNLFNMLENDYPQAFQLIEACFIVGSSMLELGDSHELEGISFVKVSENLNSVLKNIRLDKSMFDYDANYRNITKLYTMPYACIEVSDNKGVSSVIRIEDTTDALAINRRVSVLYPYLDCRAFLTGLYGKGHSTYEWRDLTNQPHDAQIPDSGFVQALSSYDIPTYSLFIDNTTAWNLQNASSAIEQARNNAMNAYHIGVRSMNTSYENSIDSANTSVTNTAASNTNMLANVNRTNTNNTNVQNTVNTLNSTMTTMQNDFNSANTDRSNGLIIDKQTAYIIQQEATFDANNDSNAITTMVQGAASVVSAGIAVAGILLAPETGGISLGATVAISAGSAGISLATQAATSAIVMSKNRDIVNAAEAYSDTDEVLTTRYNRAMTDAANTYTTDTTNTKNTTNSQVTAANNTTTAANATANASTSNANAGRTRNTANANAGESREASLFGAKTTLEQTQANLEASIKDNRRGKSQTIANAKGDPLPDLYSYRGFQVKVRTQSDDVVRRCGDTFLTYGYTLGENIEQPELNQMKHFTYWQGEPTLYGRIPTAALNEIRAMFETGVTVWSDPDTIGSSIYENM